MGIIPFLSSGPNKSVVFHREEFSIDGRAILILGADMSQFPEGNTNCNASYDLTIGDIYKDHRANYSQSLEGEEEIELLPGNAVIIQTAEEVHLPKTLFGHILPKVSLLQKGIANIPSKIDPGYSGHLLITTFNHGKRTETIARGTTFCSLHLISVEEGIRPYNKAGKQIGGRLNATMFHRWRDRFEANQVWISVGLLVFTVIAVGISVFALVRSN